VSATQNADFVKIDTYWFSHSSIIN